jgi:Flp pilus assembly protein TadG
MAPRPGLGDDRGAAAVEFAILLPLILLLLLGIIDFGRLYNARLTVTHSAREAVRVWALGGPIGDVQLAAADAAQGLTVTTTATVCTQGQPTAVTVTAPFEYVTPVGTFMQQFGGSGVADGAISRTGTMRCGG